MSNLNPYSGSWDTSKAAYLLHRTTFGASKNDIDEALKIGMEATINKLFDTKPLPAPPIHTTYQQDPFAPPGTSWVYTNVAPENAPPGLQGARKTSLYSWWVGLIHHSGISLQEKMVLFWHEHFAVNTINNPNFEYQYSILLRKHALGNFKTLTEEITICPAMLLFLNGNQNTKESPNENYARELLELFTIGRGDAVSEGDYSHYTEKDITEISRILTGWVIRYNQEGVPIGEFKNFRHDQGNKQLSHRFDHLTINNLGDEEYKKLIEIIFSKQQVARFIATKLHIWFVGSDINPHVETNIINPLSEIIVASGYEIGPALQVLLSSDYFFNGGHEGCMLSSPLDFIFKIINVFNVDISDNINKRYQIWRSIYILAASQDMAIMAIPSVAGWKAYYQEPGYYKFWINAYTLSQRKEIVNVLVNGNDDVEIDAISFIATIENASDPNALIQQMAYYLYPISLSEDQMNYLKEVLIPGLPDFEWTVEYLSFLSDPDDVAKRAGVKNKLTSVLHAMLNLPEIHLM